MQSQRRALVVAALWVPLAAGCSTAATGKIPPPAPSPAPAPTAPEKLALTPPMGFNDWNAFGCDVNEKLIKETADFFVKSGLKEAGYRYVNIDDCWSLRERGPDGKLVPDPVKFPSGIKGVADYVHQLGLKLGIYGDAGTMTCAGYPGSLGKEKLDAQTWADWGVDYLKYDNCYNQSDGSRADFVRRYTAMREAIDQTGRPMVYSICEWGQSKPWEWATGVGHLWRTTGDISDNWPSVRSIIAQNAPLARYAGPGHWNDPDMLEIGNGGMTPVEYRTHMSMWSMMAAPLIIGTDLRKATAETLAILENREIIAIDQDALGKQGVVVSETDGRMVMAKPLAGGDVAVALYNSTDSVAVISVTARDAGLAPAPAYELKDVWSGKSTHAGTTLAAGVPAHGTVVYRVSGGTTTDPSTPTTFRLRSPSAGRCVDCERASSSNGTGTVIWDCHTDANQQLTQDGRALRVLGKCLDVPLNAVNGTRVQVWDCNGGTNQQWTFNANGTVSNGRFPSLCLDVNNSGTANGTPVILWSCHGGTNQRWSRS